MKSRKASKAHIRRERSPKKLVRVLKSKGYKSGKVPKGKVPHHVKPVSGGGKTTKGNVRVVPAGKHRKIHARRRRKGQV